jgi:hypothetical protein
MEAASEAVYQPVNPVTPAATRLGRGLGRARLLVLVGQVVRAFFRALIRGRRLSLFDEVGFLVFKGLGHAWGSGKRGGKRAMTLK